MKKAVFHPEAKAELISAARWYESELPGLGTQFREEIRAAISRIQRTPEAFGIVGDGIRCHILHRFPYGVLYQVHLDQILIVAVMHLHRDPHYWEHRV
jgi:toxin ParE1/3/4